MLLYKDIHYDARVQREALALAEIGHIVNIACVREYREEPPLFHENVHIHRVDISVKKAKNALAIKDSSINNGISLKKMITKIIRNPYIKVVKDYIAYFEFFKKVSQLFEGKKIDVIHAHDLNTLWQGKMLKKLLKCKLVYDSHELFNEMAGRNRVDRKAGYFVEGRLIKSIDYFITVNEEMAKQFTILYGQMPVKIVQNIPMIQNDTETTSSFLREKYQLSPEDIILFYQGGLNPERGIEECVYTLDLLPNHYKLILLGSGRIEAKLRELVDQLKLNNRVFFHEQVPASKVSWFTNQADVGLVMYRNTSKNNYYSTPNKIFEYMQSGIPTIASNHPGKSYIVETYKTGICCEEDPKDIKEAIEKVVHDYNFYRSNCLRARETFTWDNEKENLVSLYRELSTYPVTVGERS